MSLHILITRLFSRGYNMLLRLRNLLASGSEPFPALFLVHYACEDWHVLPGGQTCRVPAIAVHCQAQGLTRLFSWSLMAEREQVCARDILCNSEDLERLLFAEFAAFLERMVEKSPQSLWVHWAMRDAIFGWPHLEHRQRLLNGSALCLREEQLVDFHAELVQVFGADFAPKPRLLRLADRNGCHSEEMLTGPQEVAALRDGAFSRLDRSVVKKAETMGKLLYLYLHDSLEIESASGRNPHFLQSQQEARGRFASPVAHVAAPAAAQFCGISRATWYRMCAAGQAPTASKLGRRRMWNVAELRAWLAAKCPPQRDWEIHFRPRSSTSNELLKDSAACMPQV
jgi:predicted DNA-binding transcriptional regulator AlpA